MKRKNIKIVALLAALTLAISPLSTFAEETPAKENAVETITETDFEEEGFLENDVSDDKQADTQEIMDKNDDSDSGSDMSDSSDATSDLQDTVFETLPEVKLNSVQKMQEADSAQGSKQTTFILFPDSLIRRAPAADT